MSAPDSPAIFDPAALARGAAAFGVPLSEGQIEKLLTFCAMLERTNRTMNLTRIPPEQYVSLHLLDSLSIALAVAPAESGSLLDAGTGAGFPGLALAIAFPALEVTLVDSTRKKLKFLADCCESLKIPNVRTVHSRMEDLGRDKRFRDSFPLVTARALAPLAPFAELILPVVSVGGVAVAYKGPGATEEISAAEAAISDLGGIIDRSVPVTLPGADASRTLVVIEKRAATPARFPRSSVR